LTSDQYISVRLRLLIDVDPERPSGISSTDAEKELAHERARDIYAFLKERNWPEPVVADSGNGSHLTYSIELPVKDDRLIEKVLSALARRFDDPVVTIDKSVHNPARICRLYGTWARKGDDTAERPHRLSKLLIIPEHQQPVTKE